MSPTEDNDWKIVVSAEDGLKKDDASAYVAWLSLIFLQEYWINYHPQIFLWVRKVCMPSSSQQ